MNYILAFTDQSKRDIQRIKKTGNKALYNKLVSLLEELEEPPTTGTGKPELLKYYQDPTWSRRLSREHRLIYRVEETSVTVLVLSSWGHYDDK